MKRLTIAVVFLLCAALIAPLVFTALQHVQMPEMKQYDFHDYQHATIDAPLQPNGPGSGGGGGGGI